MALLTRLAMTAFAASAAVAIAAPASATNFFANFDDISVPSGGYVTVQEADGFVATSGPGIEIQNHAAGDPYSSPNLVELDSDANSAMSHPIDAGYYSLSFYYSPRPGVPIDSNGIDVYLGSASDPMATLIFTVTGSGSALPNTLYSYETTLFTATVADTYLTFAAIGTSDSLGGYVDDINVAAVPEPTTWAMMLGGFGIVGAGLRRRSTHAAVQAV